MSSSGVFGPPPAGIDLSETQDASVRASVISLMIIATVAVALRVLVRTIKKLGGGLSIDDFSIMLGLLFAHGTATCCLVSLPYGSGKHLWVLSAEQFTTIWQILFAYVMIYACAVTFTKLSIVLFYRRIFGMKWTLWLCAFLALSYLVTVVVTILVACRPIPYFWTRYTTASAVGQCIDVPLFFFANGMWAMLVDVCILIVPLPIIHHLQMGKNQKIGVALIFLLGSFVCVASIIRIQTIHTLIKSTDLTWAMGQVFIWSCCEPFIGIVCACLPTFAPLVRQWWTSHHSSNDSDPSHHKSDPLVTFGQRSARKPTLSMTGRMFSTKTVGNNNDHYDEIVTIAGKDRLRMDDEIELTNNVTGNGSFRTMDDGGSTMEGIRMTKDVVWHSQYHPETFRP